MAPKAKVANAKEVELNRWCIEMAMRWPIVETGGHHLGGGAYGQQVGGYIPSSRVDADVIGRAKKLRDWVNAAS